MEELGHPAGSYSLRNAGTGGEHRRWHGDHARFPSGAERRLRFVGPRVLDPESSLSRANLALAYEGFARDVCGRDPEIGAYAAGVALGKQGGEKLEAVLDMLRVRVPKGRRMRASTSDGAGSPAVPPEPQHIESTSTQFEASMGGARAAALYAARQCSVEWRKVQGHGWYCACANCAPVEKAVRALIKGLTSVGQPRK